MKKEDKEWMTEYVNKIKNTDWSKHKFEVKKIDYGNSYQTLKHISPNILRILKSNWF